MYPENNMIKHWDLGGSWIVKNNGINSMDKMIHRDHQYHTKQIKR